MIQKQQALENALGMSLTSKQIDAIEKGWNEFYTDPLKYRNSIVVDMVKLSLKEV